MFLFILNLKVCSLIILPPLLETADPLFDADMWCSFKLKIQTSLVPISVGKTISWKNIYHTEMEYKRLLLRHLKL